MREALTEALQDYDGALVVVSHDRHLLRTTTDALWLVADGRVAPFDGDLDDYRDWVLAAEPARRADAADAGSRRGNRKAQKRAEAEARQREYAQKKPLADKLAKLEREMAALDAERKAVEDWLASPAAYAEAEQGGAEGTHRAPGRPRVATRPARRRSGSKSPKRWRSGVGSAIGVGCDLISRCACPATIAVAMGDAAELMRGSSRAGRSRRSSHGATRTRSSSAMPGRASTAQTRKNVNHPVCSTTHPVDALTTVRGTAARLVKQRELRSPCSAGRWRAR